MDSAKNTARLAGLLWLLAAVPGGFGLFYARSMVVTGDAAATAANIVAYESSFRAAIVSSLVSQLFMFCFGVILFQLFKEVNKILAIVLFTSLKARSGCHLIAGPFGRYWFTSKRATLEAGLLDYPSA
jgi:hypothetical protein